MVWYHASMSRFYRKFARWNVTGECRSIIMFKEVLIQGSLIWNAGNTGTTARERRQQPHIGWNWSQCYRVWVSVFRCFCLRSSSGTILEGCFLVCGGQRQTSAERSCQLVAWGRAKAAHANARTCYNVFHMLPCQHKPFSVLIR